MSLLADMSFTFDTFAAGLALVAAAATFAVCKWRIGDLERRVDILETSERSHSDRVVVIETKLESIESLLKRLVEKLDAK